MKQFVADRHTTPGTATLEPVNIPKVPVYDTAADVEADLTNLNQNQIFLTSDTGNEKAQPVDKVEEGNLHAVTSDAVAESLSYSTEETLTGGKWIDGKPIYKKTIELGTLPINTNKQVNHNITNLSKIIEIKGIAVSTTYLPLPRSQSTQNLNIDIFANTEKVVVFTASDMSEYTGFATLYYTKTTD